MTWRRRLGLLPALADADWLRATFGNPVRCAIVLLMMTCLHVSLSRAEEQAPTEGTKAEPATNTVVASEEALAAARTLQQMQDQLQIIQQHLDQNRKEAEAAAVRNNEAMANRLQNIEQSLSDQRSRQMESLESATRWILGGAGVFALLACITVVAMAWFQWRTMGKLAEITSAIPRGLAGGEQVPALGVGDSVSAPVEQANLRFLGSLDRLEKRLLELEAFTRPVLEHHNAESGTVSHAGTGKAEAGNGSGGEDISRATSLVGKANSLLSLDKYEEALECINEALSLEPGHAQALLKKATALERLGKLEDALDFFDQAITADPSVTVAYLHKGAICNRLERFTEALDCYERALQTSEPAKA